jgi:hypothetical protein
LTLDFSPNGWTTSPYTLSRSILTLYEPESDSNKSEKRDGADEKMGKELEQQLLNKFVPQRTSPVPAVDGIVWEVEQKVQVAFR